MRRRRSPALLAAAVAGGLLSPAFPARGTDLRIDVFADQQQPAANDLVRLTYKLSGDGLSGDIKAPSPLPLKNLALAGGPSRSDQVSFVNGVFSRSLSLTYYLRPKGPGSAEVGETVWTVGDKTLKAAPFLFEVGPPRPGGGSQPGNEEPEDPLAGFLGSRGLGRPGPGIGPGVGAERHREKPIVELLVTPDKTTAYVGEEITLLVELVTSADVQGLEWLEAPKFPGAWAEDLERPERPTGRRDTVGGRPVMRFTLLKKLVSGLAPGTLGIPPMRIRTSIRAAGDPFGDPFGFFRSQPVELASKPLTLKILPIPGAAAFNGPVGRFSLTASLDKTHVAVGEAATLKVRLSGPGGLRTATEPPKVTVQGATVYPPTAKTTPPRSGTAGEVAWNYVLVPTAPGEVTIPPVSLETFDPAEKKIVTRVAAPLRLVVEAAAATAAALPGTAASPAGIAETIVPTPPATSAAAVTLSLPGPTLDLSRRTVTLPLWLLLAVPGAAVAIAGIWLVSRRRKTGRAGFRDALEPEAGETKERVAARIDRALREGLARRYGTLDGSPTNAAIVSILEERHAPEELRRETEALLSDLDFLRFAPQLGDYSAKIAEVREAASRIFPRLF
ncbi:MAG: BatD family protein [Acidithiobacillales bacterium]